MFSVVLFAQDAGKEKMELSIFLTVCLNLFLGVTHICIYISFHFAYTYLHA